MIALLALLGCPTPAPHVTLTVPAPAEAPEPTTPEDTGPPPIEDADGDGVPDEVDCAPSDADVFPGAAERCNGIDDDCDGPIDEGFDADGDGWLPAGGVCAGLPTARDCDDGDPGASPDAAEACDGVDNDCNGMIDDVPDRDGDGASCDDCDDGDPSAYPGATEVCDGVDNDCTGAPDEAWDLDGDGASPCGGDCDEANRYRSGHLPEVCDGVDNDCDDAVDEGFDADGDGASTCRGDCDDADSTINPAQPEVCGDGLDNDCDPNTDEVSDLDGDGFTYCAGDCDDLDPLALPGGVEVCDGADNDCNGFPDESPECWDCVTVDRWLVCTVSTDWITAELVCNGFGTSLASIADAATNAALADAALTRTGNSIWIGFHDQAVEGTFAWSNGAAVTYTSWYPGEPNDSGGEDCGSTNFAAVGYWNDYPCSYILPFVCDL
jgi:hypothetical protein